MDPVSIIGLLSTAGTIAATVTCTIKSLSQLRGQFEDADLRIRLLIGELSTIKSALTQINDWTHYLDDVHRQADVLEGLQISLDGCQLAMNALADEINLVLEGTTASGRGSDMGFKGRAKYVWNENTLKEHENRLRAQISALQLLLQAVQCSSRPEQAQLLHAPKSRQIMQKVADDTSSMRATMSVSQYSQAPTIRSHEDSVLDGRTFDWDDEIVNAATYRRTLNHARSKNSAASPSPQEEIQEKSSQSATEESVGRTASVGESPKMPSLPRRPLPYDMSKSSEIPTSYAQRNHQARPDAVIPKIGNKSQTSLLHRIKSADGEKKSFWRSLSSKRTSRNISTAEQASNSFPVLDNRRGRRGFENSSHTSIDFGSEDGISAPAIVRAAQAGSVVEIDMLLDQRSDIHARHAQSGRNALAVASHCGNEEVVALLLQYGASVNDQDASSMTPLHLASLRGHSGVADLLLQERADVDAKGPNKQTPLMIAAEKRQVEFARTLLRWRAKVNARDTKQLTPLHVAARQGDDSMTELLLGHGAHVEAKDADFMGATHYACENGFDKVLTCLLAEKADIEAPGKASMTPLLCAASSGQVHIVEVLLKRKASLKHKGEGDMTAVHWASYNGHVEVLDLLIQKKASVAAVNKDGRSALHLAIIAGNFAAAELLLRKGANVEGQCKLLRRPMHYACTESNLEIARLLFGHNASIEEEDGAGQRPLHMACVNGSLAFVEILVDKGADIEARDSNGDRPLCLASSLGHLDIVRLLLNRGAAMRMKYASGPSHEDSPLCLAAQRGHVAIVEEFVMRGSSVLQKDEHNWQPLRYAAYNAHPEVVQFLLKHGATVSGNASGGWGFNVTAQRIGFAHDLTNQQQRKGEVLRLLTTAEAREKQTQEQQASKDILVAPAIQHQTASIELPSLSTAGLSVQKPSSTPPKSPVGAPTELALHSPTAERQQQQQQSQSPHIPSQIDRSSVATSMIPQLYTPHRVPSVSSPQTSQNHDIGPPNPGAYSPRPHIQSIGHDAGSPSSAMSPTINLSPTSQQAPLINQQAAPFSLPYHTTVSENPAATTTSGPDDFMDLGPNGLWQRISSPREQPKIPPSTASPDIKQLLYPAYPSGVHEMPS